MNFGLTKVSFVVAILCSVSLVQACGSTSSPGQLPPSGKQSQSDDSSQEAGPTIFETPANDPKPKEEKPDTTVLRRQISNLTSKIDRTQFELDRVEQTRSQMIAERTASETELADTILNTDTTIRIGGGIGGDGINGGISNPQESIEALEAVIEQQNVEINKLDQKIETLKQSIRALELELDELTLQLEKKK